MPQNIYFRKIRQNRYVDLTNDSGFRYYFSTNKAVLLFFIKSFLPTAVDILDVQIIDKEKSQQFGELILLDTSIPPTAPSKKHVILDLLVLLSTGEVVHLEMQRHRNSPALRAGLIHLKAELSQLFARFGRARFFLQLM